MNVTESPSVGRIEYMKMLVKLGSMPSKVVNRRHSSSSSFLNIEFDGKRSFDAFLYLHAPYIVIIIILWIIFYIHS